jgi:hypothetical protein
MRPFGGVLRPLLMREASWFYNLCGLSVASLEH